MPHTKTLHAALAATLALTFAAGCAGVQKPESEPIPESSLDMDPMLVKAQLDEGGGVKETVVLDSTTLFSEATGHFKKRQYDRAIEGYGKILEHFADSKYYLPSLYNSGLAYERLSRWQDAVEVYERVLEVAPGKDEGTDAMYRMAECYANLEQWRDVVAMTARILDRTNLSAYDKIEANTRRADALAELGKLSEAETTYRAALAIHAGAKGEQAVPKDSHFVAAAGFGLSRIYHRLFSRIKFILPTERMETDLEDKVQLFMQAQSSYIRVMRRGNPFWATAAGFHIGKMYEDFYTALLEAEIPDDLTKEEVNIYFSELRKEIKPLMERAMQIYEKNIIMSERYGITNDYTERTQEALDRLKRYIVDDKLQAREQDKVLEGEEIDLPGETVEEDDEALKATEASEG